MGLSVRSGTGGVSERRPVARQNGLRHQEWIWSGVTGRLRSPNDTLRMWAGWITRDGFPVADALAGQAQDEAPMADDHGFAPVRASTHFFSEETGSRGDGVNGFFLVGPPFFVEMGEIMLGPGHAEVASR